MFWIISIVLSGLIVGALGRLAVPGPNPMSIGKTILIGIGGSLVGGIVGALLFRDDAQVVQVILQVLAAAGIVYFLERRELAA